MATVPGAHFLFTASLPPNIVETTTGTGLPAPILGDFNLEVFVGSAGNAPPLAPGYQGLAVLSPSGLELDLISGVFAVTDEGTSGNDTLSAYGAGETIIGSPSGTTLNVFGNADTAVGGGGSDAINVSGFVDLVEGGSGSDTIGVSGLFDTVDGGTGATDLITAGGVFNQVNAGTGNDTINLTGTDDTVTSGVGAGVNQDLINLSGTNLTVSDGPNQYADTVVGFDQSVGDRIHLTTDTVADALAHSTQVNGGADTLITLSDGSTILLKGVTHIDGTFFS